MAHKIVTPHHLYQSITLAYPEQISAIVVIFRNTIMNSINLEIWGHIPIRGAN